MFGGIDSGKSGCAVLINQDREIVDVRFQPLLPGAKGDQFDIPGMCAILRDWQECGVRHVVLEQLQPMGKGRMSAHSVFSQAGTYWIWRALLSACEIPHSVLRAQAWKKILGVPVPGKEKPRPKPAPPLKTASPVERAEYEILLKEWEANDRRRLTKNREAGKGETIRFAQSLFPGADFRRTPRCKTPDDNKADAALMAEVARRQAG